MTSTCLYLQVVHSHQKDTPCRDDWVCLWMGESLNESLACRKTFHNAAADSQSKKLQTYKIIRHQKLDFVVFSCDSVFFLQDLYVFVHVHPLHQLYYLCLALEEAEVGISYYAWWDVVCTGEQSGCQDVVHVWGSDQNWTCEGCIFSTCCTELQFAVFPAPVWSEKSRK